MTWTRETSISDRLRLVNASTTHKLSGSKDLSTRDKQDPDQDSGGVILSPNGGRHLNKATQDKTRFNVCWIDSSLDQAPCEPYECHASGDEDETDPLIRLESSFQKHDGKNADPKDE